MHHTQNTTWCDMENIETFKVNHTLAELWKTDKLVMDVADSDMVSPPHVADMSLCEERLKTFDEWPKYMRPTPLELAKAGFYYTGMGDRVMCFSCKVVLKNWEPSDTAWDEHARWRSSCSYLRMAYCKPKATLRLHHHRGFDICDGPKTAIPGESLGLGGAGWPWLPFKDDHEEGTFKL